MFRCSQSGIDAKWTLTQPAKAVSALLAKFVSTFIKLAIYE